MSMSIHTTKIKCMACGYESETVLEEDFNFYCAKCVEGVDGLMVTKRKHNRPKMVPLKEM